MDKRSVLVVAGAFGLLGSAYAVKKLLENPKVREHLKDSIPLIPADLDTPSNLIKRVRKDSAHQS